MDPVDAILEQHGIRGPWTTLPSTGVANRIYATAEAVLRMATDHPEAVEDARTESVAAPAARAAGVLVPQLIAFDDTRMLVDRPYSIWERVHGETLGLLPPSGDLDATWAAVGRQLALLHTRVRDCADPNGWLDDPSRDLHLGARAASLASAGALDPATAATVARWIDALAPSVAIETPRCFVHNDVWEMNVMCSRGGALLAVIDWGDAGWGDPAVELAQVPLAAIDRVLEGYESEAPELLGDAPEARIVWDRLHYALDALPADRRPLDGLMRFVRDNGVRWRRFAS